MKLKGYFFFFKSGTGIVEHAISWNIFSRTQGEKNASTPFIYSFSQSLNKYPLITNYMPVTVLGFRDYVGYLQSYLEGEGKPVSK